MELMEPKKSAVIWGAPEKSRAVQPRKPECKSLDPGNSEQC